MGYFLPSETGEGGSGPESDWSSVVLSLSGGFGVLVRGLWHFKIPFINIQELGENLPGLTCQNRYNPALPQPSNKSGKEDPEIQIEKRA